MGSPVGLSVQQTRAMRTRLKDMCLLIRLVKLFGPYECAADKALSWTGGGIPV
jgi:hypothetical protein